MEEGLAREIVSKIQQLRKNQDFDILDQVQIKVQGDEAVQRAVSAFEEYIKTETLATTIAFESVDAPSHDLNGHDTKLLVERK